MTTSPAGTEVSAPVRSRLRLWILGLVLLGAAAALVRYFGAEEAAEGAARRGGGGGFRRGGPDQTVPVRLVTAERRDIDVHLRALGTVTSLSTVTVRSRLDGELVRVLFTEGQHVSAGQLLAEIDPRPYEAQLAQALGQQAENKARLDNARADLARLHKLVEEGLVTQQQVSSQESLVGQYQGALQSNEAQVKTARLNLSYTRIVAPISGRLGLRQVDPGNLVRTGDANGLVVITQLRPISVIFTVPEAELPAVLEATRAGRRLPAEAWDRADSVKLADGRLETVDNQIDTATGTIRLRATFDNADQQLFPNQFVNVRLRVRTLEGATAIPAAAVQRASFGTFVYVVKPDETVTISRVTLGPQEGDRVAVAQGLEAGAKVVIEGVDNLTEGARVEVIGAGDAGAPPAAGDAAAPEAGGRRP
jgi:multidrug efflux system membrane fusion protein